MIKAPDIEDFELQITLRSYEPHYCVKYHMSPPEVKHDRFNIILAMMHDDLTKAIKEHKEGE